MFTLFFKLTLYISYYVIRMFDHRICGKTDIFKAMFFLRTEYSPAFTTHSSQSPFVNDFDFLVICLNCCFICFSCNNKYILLPLHITFEFP